MPLDPIKIRKLREQKFPSQAAAAHAAGMNQPNWARIESGRNPDVLLSTAEAIARALGVSTVKILV